MNTYVKIHIPTAAYGTHRPLDGQHLCFGHVIDREHGPKHMPVLLDVAYCIPWWRLHFHLQSVTSTQEKELEKRLYKYSTFCKDNILLNKSVLL